MGVIFEIDRLKKEALVLRKLLLKFKDEEPDANLCLQALEPIIKKVLDGEITKPILIGDIPCGYYFTEGSLRPISGMLESYANFANHIEGMNSDEARKFFDDMEKEIEEEKK